MIIKILNKILKVSLEAKEENLYKDNRYKETLKNYEDQYVNVKSYLPVECGFEVLDGLDSASGELSRIEKEYFYRMGVRDTMHLLKEN